MKNFEKYSKENIHFYNSPAPKMLSDLVKKINPDSVADFGCGDGAILYNLIVNNLLKDIKEIIAIDLSEERLKRIKSNLGDNVKTICSDASEVKAMQNGLVNLVICTQVIEHVPDEKKLLAEIYRILKPGGFLYISSVVKKWYGWYFYRANGKWALDPTHLREYSSASQFCSLVSDSGFKISSQRLSIFRPSVGNALLRLLIKSGLFKETNKSGKVYNLISKLTLPIPGYYIVEVMAEKI